MQPPRYPNADPRSGWGAIAFLAALALAAAAGIAAVVYVASVW